VDILNHPVCISWSYLLVYKWIAAVLSFEGQPLFVKAAHIHVFRETKYLKILNFLNDKLLFVRHLFNYPNEIHTLYLIHIYTVLFPRFGVSYTIFRENLVFLTQNRLLVQSCCLWYIGCIIKYKRYSQYTITPPKQDKGSSEGLYALWTQV
jgi:hypothetical protein